MLEIQRGKRLAQLRHLPLHSPTVCLRGRCISAPRSHLLFRREILRPHHLQSRANGLHLRLQIVHLSHPQLALGRVHLHLRREHLQRPQVPRTGARAGSRAGARGEARASGRIIMRRELPGRVRDGVGLLVGCADGGGAVEELESPLGFWGGGCRGGGGCSDGEGARGGPERAFDEVLRGRCHCPGAHRVLEGGGLAVSGGSHVEEFAGEGLVHAAAGGGVDDLRALLVDGFGCGAPGRGFHDVLRGLNSAVVMSEVELNGSWSLCNNLDELEPGGAGGRVDRTCV
mmetsp:Transcript_25183/g.63004  ORF Transcript_25183/g.63004 Transcript_25183/m.63004 type:complete len:286 (-) Transcript_25183:37-894(-)